MRTTFRLWLRLNRVTLAITVLVMAIASLFGVLYASTVACDPSLGPADCARFLNANLPSTAFTAVLALLPIALGIILGVAAIGREIDDHTAAFPWSMTTSRRRWLTERVAIDALAVALIGLLSGIVNAVLVAKLNPGHDLAASFVGYGLWGPILIARGLCAYAVGLVLGATLGRVMPAMTIAMLVAASVTIAALVVGRSFEPATLVPGRDPSLSDAMIVQVGGLTPDGRFVPMIDCPKYIPAPPSGLSSDQLDAWYSCPAAASYLLGHQMPGVEFREGAMLLLVAVGFGALAYAAVGRRTP